jgi:hypothetical protein
MGATMLTGTVPLSGEVVCIVLWAAVPCCVGVR